MTDQNGDPLAMLQELWQAAKWPLLGVFLLVVSLVWAMVSSFQISTELRKKPPKIPRAMGN